MTDEPDVPLDVSSLADAEQQAAAMLRAAEEAAVATGREMVEEARAVRRRMLEDARAKRAAVRVELERARQAIDEALAALDAADGSTATAPEAPREIHRPGRAAADRKVEEAFAALKDASAAPPAAPPEPKAAPPSQALSEPEPVVEDAPDVPDDESPAAPDPEPTGDDAARARRDAELTPLVPDATRAVKRLLQDEQNLLLDAGRRARKLEAERLLPEADDHCDTWVEVLRPAADAAYSSGRGVTGRRRKAATAPDRLVVELAAGLVSPLRERLAATIDEVVARGPYASAAEQHRELTAAVGARYREWKARDLDLVLDDLLASAYARGAFDATPSGGRLRWVPDRPGRCPDCDDNALEPTLKGSDFPTGQPHPPAHPGCRCSVVPVTDP